MAWQRQRSICRFGRTQETGIAQSLRLTKKTDSTERRCLYLWRFLYQ
jgi:hypothetical protein